MKDKFHITPSAEWFFYAKNSMEVDGEYRLARIGDSIEADLQMRADYNAL